jgi:hypothetical protein
LLSKIFFLHTQAVWFLPLHLSAHRFLVARPEICFSSAHRLPHLFPAQCLLQPSSRVGCRSEAILPARKPESEIYRSYVEFCCSGILSISLSDHTSISFVVAGFRSAVSFPPVHFDLWYRFPAVESLGAAFMKENNFFWYVWILLPDFWLKVLFA